jgi:hypothetical protein
VDLMVFWQAQPIQGGLQETRSHQVWTLDDGNQSTLPRIRSYIVEELPNGDIWEKYMRYLEGQRFDQWGDL